jgi:predicted ABC-class ATPase
MRTLGVASYERVRIYVGSIYAKNPTKRLFVRRLIEIESHEMLHSVLDKLSIVWWKSEKRIKKGTDMLLEASRPYMDEYWGMWYQTVPSKQTWKKGAYDSAAREPSPHRMSAVEKVKRK